MYKVPFCHISRPALAHARRIMAQTGDENLRKAEPLFMFCTGETWSTVSCWSYGTQKKFEAIASETPYVKFAYDYAIEVETGHLYLPGEPRKLLEFTKANIKEMVKHYLLAVAWTSEEPLEFKKNYQEIEVTRSAQLRAYFDCGSFLGSARCFTDNVPINQFGHDFWLARNGHGCGFSDRREYPHKDVLQKKAEEFGEVEPQKVNGKLDFYP
jgi:hypothetical protein